MFVYRVTKIIPLAARVSQILLAPLNDGAALTYEAGQYVSILHQDETISFLSIACAPNDDGILEFHLFHPTENVKAQNLLSMAEKDKIWVMNGPFGKCTISYLKPDMPIIFIARNTGLASIKAVIEELVRVPNHPPLYLYWSVPKREDLYLIHLVQEWASTIDNFIFVPVLTEPFVNAEITNSHFLQDIILHDHPNLNHYQAYLSGPHLLAKATFFTLHPYGLQKERFHADTVA